MKNKINMGEFVLLNRLDATLKKAKKENRPKVSLNISINTLAWIVKEIKAYYDLILELQEKQESHHV